MPRRSSSHRSWLPAFCASGWRICGAQPALRGQPRDAENRTGNPFAALDDPSIKDPDNPAKKFRVDFARSSMSSRLSRADLMKMTPENARRRYAGAGRPDLWATDRRPDSRWPVQGQSVLCPKGTGWSDRGSRRSSAASGSLAGERIEPLESVGRADLWKGKVFERDERILRNMIENRRPAAPLVDDIDDVPTTEIPREILGTG